MLKKKRNIKKSMRRPNKTHSMKKTWTKSN